MAHTEHELPLFDGRIGRRMAAYSPSIRMLEDEIYLLRRTMERTYLEEASFNADRVIEISRRLDVKINEYMRHMMLCANE